MQLPSPFTAPVGFACIANDAAEQSSLFDGVTPFGPKRQREFLLGRAAACAALAAIGITDAAPLRAADGLPLWPPGTLGSISHKRDLAVAAAARTSTHLALGIDLELESPRAVRLLERTANDTEREWVMQNDPELHAMLLFSTKESIYKALYPICRRFFGFDAVELRPATAHSLIATLRESLSPELPAGFEFVTRFSRGNGYLVSGVEL